LKNRRQAMVQAKAIYRVLAGQENSLTTYKSARSFVFPDGSRRLLSPRRCHFGILETKNRLYFKKGFYGLFSEFTMLTQPAQNDGQFAAGALHAPSAAIERPIAEEAPTACFLYLELLFVAHRQPLRARDALDFCAARMAHCSALARQYKLRRVKSVGGWLFVGRLRPFTNEPPSQRLARTALAMRDSLARHPPPAALGECVLHIGLGRRIDETRRCAEAAPIGGIRCTADFWRDADPDCLFAPCSAPDDTGDRLLIGWEPQAPEDWIEAVHERFPDSVVIGHLPLATDAAAFEDDPAQWIEAVAAQFPEWRAPAASPEEESEPVQSASSG
jgi:hypothetical protein